MRIIFNVCSDFECNFSSVHWMANGFFLYLSAERKKTLAIRYEIAHANHFDKSHIRVQHMDVDSEKENNFMCIFKWNTSVHMYKE